MRPRVLHATPDDIDRLFAKMDPRTKVTDAQVDAEILRTKSAIVAARNLRLIAASDSIPWVIWLGAFGGGARELRTTGPWWAVAGIAFVTSGVTAAALSRFPPPWRRLRLLRWVAGAALVLLLAQFGHPSSAPEGVGPAVHLAASLAALVLAALMGLLGAYVAVRR